MPEFEIWQDGIMVASVICNDRELALSEIMHYAWVYLQDGPVKVREVESE